MLIYLLLILNDNFSTTATAITKKRLWIEWIVKWEEEEVEQNKKKSW